MFKKVIVLSALAATVMLAGCAGAIPMESKEVESATKTFQNPPNGMAGLYIYRGSNRFGTLDTPLKISLDTNIIGINLQNVYFYKAISPGPHRVDTQTTIGPADPVTFYAEAGHNYFIKQDTKVTNLYGLAGGTAIKMVDETEGKKGVLECEQAK